MGTLLSHCRLCFSLTNLALLISTQEWAASVIGAHVKGYLVRRIMATDKVRSLIQTIKDALICAMDLHSESTENIRASDVELHRRLIQQVKLHIFISSAAKTLFFQLINRMI